VAFGVISAARELRHYAVKMSGVYYGITKKDLCKLAYQLATKNNIVHPFNNDWKAAGTDWFHGFLQRHQDLSTRAFQSQQACRK